MPHAISLEGLLDYVEGRAHPECAQRIQAHLEEGCQDCAADVAWLQHTLDLMATDELVSAPPELIQRAQGLYRPPKRRPRAVLSALWAQFRGSQRARYAAAVVAACVLVLGGWWTWGNTTVAQAATLSEVSGPVYVLLPGADGWQPGESGMALTAGSTLRSGDGGAAWLVYPDGSHTEITPRSQVEIVSVVGKRNLDATSVSLNQVEGHSEHELTRGESSVEVKAQGASAQGHKGNYEIEVENSAVEVHARSGSVDVRVGETTTQLSPGERGLVENGKVKIEPSPAASNRSESDVQAAPAAEPKGPQASRQPSSRGGNSEQSASPPGQAKDKRQGPEGKGPSSPASVAKEAGNSADAPGQQKLR